MKKKSNYEIVHEDKRFRKSWQWFLHRFQTNRELKDRMFVMLFSDKHRILEEYAIFIDTIRKYQKAGNVLKMAVELAVDECIKNNVLREFLQKNRNEVINVLLTEYNEKEHIKMEREDAYAEGKEYEVFSSVFEKDYSKERGAEKLNVSKEVFEKRYREWLEKSKD